MHAGNSNYNNIVHEPKCTEVAKSIDLYSVNAANPGNPLVVLHVSRMTFVRSCPAVDPITSNLSSAYPYISLLPHKTPRI